MVKTKKKGRPTPSRRFVEKLSMAVDLLEHNQAMEAMPILKTLQKTHPNHPDVLAASAQAYYDLHDADGYEHALHHLYEMKPHSPDVILSLANAYLGNDRPMLAMNLFQEYLHRWPDHPEADNARKAVVALDKEIQKLIEKTGLDNESAKELLLQHEQLLSYIGNEQYHQGLRLAEKILRRHPSFVPALNNLGQIYATQGEIDRAIEIAHKVLALQPDNVHALSNLVRLHFLSGQMLEAQQFADRLKSSSAEAADRWTKIAEALTFIGDDEGVLALYRQARNAGDLKSNDVNEIFFHLAAVSACRLGREKEARSYWKESQQINQNFDWARQNLADLDKPPEKRHGPWAYPFESWLLGAMVQDLARLPDKDKRAGNKTGLQKLVSQFLEKHPQIIFLAPYLIERGDEKACEFIFRLAAVSEHPELLKTAKSFLTGKRGSLDLRMQCSQVLSEAKILPSGAIRMWTGRDWSDIMMLNFEIDPEPEENQLPREAEKLSMKAWEALNEKDGSKAQVILEEALMLCPEDPHLLNNLALAYEIQGHYDEAHKMIYEIHTRFPDYFFGIAGVARLAITDGDLEKARDLLEGLMQRKKMHPSEFNALCMGEIELWLAEGKPKAAKTWIEMWERVDPDNPELPHFRRRVGNPRRN